MSVWLIVGLIVLVIAIMAALAGDAPLEGCVSVVVVLAILTPGACYFRNRQRNNQCLESLARIASAVEKFRDTCGRYPSLDVGLGALAEAPVDCPAGSGPFMESERLTDPWGREFNYVLREGTEPSFAVWSTGKSLDDSEDDFRVSKPLY